MNDILQRRILGAVRFVDIATNARIGRPLQVTAGKLAFRRNLSGDYAITRADDPDLLKHLDEFEKPPAAPAAPVTFFAQVKDPSGEFLPRDFSVDLPRDPNPANAANSTSLFRPIEVAMLSSANRYIAANWCVIRVSARNTTTDQPLLRAGVRVAAASQPPQTVFGMTEANGPTAGEAIVILPGLAFHTVSQDPNNNAELVLTEVDATLEVFAHKQGGAVWPELIAANDNNLIKSAPVTLKVAPGRTISRNAGIAVPNP